MLVCGTSTSSTHDQLEYLQTARSTWSRSRSRCVAPGAEAQPADSNRRAGWLNAMRICFVSHSAKLGGAERVLLETIEILRSQGIECRVILPERGDFCTEVARLRVPYAVVSFAHWMGRGRPTFARRLEAALNIVMKTPMIAWKVLRWGCDIVYTNTSTVCVGAFAARLLGRPHVWHLHEFGLEDQGLSFIFGERFSLAVINRLSARCICVSRALARKYSRSIPEPKIAVIYPSMHQALSGCEDAVDHATPIFRRSGRFRTVIVGTLIEGKGQAEAIRALAHLKQMGTDAELMIVGDGIPGYRCRLQELIQSHGLEGRVVLTGPVEDALPAMQGSDAVLVCSKSEAFGRVTIEGMLAGKPVIGARSGANAELIKDGVNGLLYNLGEPENLAEKIRYLAENPAVAARLGENAQAWVRSFFTPTRYSREIMAVLSALHPGVEVQAGSQAKA